MVMPYASVVHGTTLGKNVKVYQGAIVGADPQDFRWKGDDTYCYIGDDTVIREHVIVNRGIRPEGGTNVGNNCFVFANSHVGHDSQVGDHCVIGNNVNLAGCVILDPGVILSSAVVVHEGCRVGKLALIKGGTRISTNVPPFVIMAHNPVSYYGVNSYILQKHAGFSEAQIEDIAKAYRHLYQSQTSVFNALKRIEADVDQSVWRDDILDFVRASKLVIAGHRFKGAD